MKKSLIYATTLILLALFQQVKAQLYIAPGETIYSTSGATLYLKEALAGDATSIYGPGELSLTSSTLQLNPNADYINSTIIHSNLSTISTIGVTADRIFTVGSLDMQGNTTISLASNTVHELHFQPSGGYNWQGTLTISGWQGNYNGTSGTKGKVFFGTNQWGLESFFHVPMIKFYDGTYTYDAIHLTTGEIVPSVYISTSPNTILASSLCVASTFDLNFTYNSVQNFGASTTFTAQLSNEAGSFTSPTNIGTVAGNASGDQNISVTIPSGLTGGAGYRIRVISNTPSVTGSDNGTDIYIKAFTAGEIAATGETICSGVAPSQIGSTTAASGGDNTITYSWRSSADNYATAIAGATAATYTPPSSLNTTTSYKRYAADGLCSTTATASTGTWTVTALPVFTAGEIAATGETICSGVAPSQIASTTAASGGDNTITYSWRSSADNYATAIVGATSATYTPPSSLNTTTSYRRYAKDATCNTTPTASTGTWTVTVLPVFTAGEITATGESICSGANTSEITSITAASGGDNTITYSWRSSADNYATAIAGANSATYTPPTNLTTATSYRRYASDGVCNTTPQAAVGTWTVGINISLAGTITGSSSVCSGSSTSLTLAGHSGSIQWQKSSSLNGTYTAISGATSPITSTGTLTADTYFRTAVTNGSCTTMNSDAFLVSVTGTLAAIPSITGASTAVLGSNMTYSITPVANAVSYIWDMPAGMTVTAYPNNGATVQVDVAGNYQTNSIKVKAVNGCFSTAWQTKTVYAPGQTGISITTTQGGAPVICGGATNVPFSVTAATGATYAWTLPTGLSFAAGYDGDEQTTYVNFAAGYVGGAITCVRTTATATNTASYSVGGLATPGSISGLAVLCDITTTTYSIGSVPNATSYVWQLPTGMSGTSTTNSITATWTGIVSGTVKVRAIGTCGTSAWRTLSVGAVATPSAISGPTMICGAATYTITSSTMTQVSQTTLNYSVTNVSGMNYAWTVPTGMTITSGGTTNAIVVEVDPTTFTSGQVSVTATSQTSNTCVSPARTLTVTKSVASITGPTAICGLSTATYSVPAGSGSAYTWTLPSWMTPATGYTLTSNPIQVDIAATGTSTQSLSVEIETSCGTVTVSRSVGCGLYTQLSSASCGAAVSSLSAGISANNIAGAQGYKFQIAIPSQSATTYYYIESSDRWFAISEATSMPQLYGTTYSIKVSLDLGNSWGDYGAACTVSTPALPTTTLSNASCGASLSSISTGISSNNVQGATMYRFTITPSGSQTSYEVNSPDRWFALTEATGMPLLYGTTYSITVTLENGAGVWGTAGAACTVTTPTLPTTMLSNASCGATLSSLSAGISANNVQGTTTYRFTITPNIQNATSYTVDSPDRWFALTEATGMSLLYGTTYSVTVTLENGTGIWGTAGTACTVTTPTLPTTTLSIASCGATLTSFSTVISANNVQGATMYEFHITDGATLLEYTVQSPDRWITLSEGQSVGQTPQALVPTWDNVYTIKVKVQSGSAWSAYGTECFVNTAYQGLAQQDPQLHEEQTEGLGIEESSNVNGLEENQLQNTTWTATATSNPFAHSFQIKLNGAEGIENATEFTTQLTDMSGKVYSQAMLSKEQLEAESFGEQLAPGMYLMTLRQGEELRVLRVVKR